MRAGLDRVGALLPGTGFAELAAGVSHDFQKGLDAFVRGEIGFKPRENVDLFGFAQADRVGVQAGVGARVTW